MPTKPIRYVLLLLIILSCSKSKMLKTDTEEKGPVNMELLQAAKDGDLETVKDLISDGVAMNRTNDNGMTALMLAVWHNHPEVVQALLDAGADTSIKNKNSMTALMLATWHGHKEISQILWGKSGDASRKSGDDITARIFAGQDVKQRKARMLQKRGGRGREGGISADNGLGTPADMSPGLKKVDREGISFSKRVLPAGTTNVMIDKRLIDPPLIAAAREGDTGAVKDLLDKGADPQVKEQKMGATALIVAAEHGYTETVKALLDKGADVNEKDSFGRTALMEAVEYGQISTVKTLLGRGADPKIKDMFGATAIKLAKKKGFSVIAQLFKKGKDKLDDRDNITLKAPKESAPGARWAVIIGVSEYKDTNIPPLRYASVDARAFYDWTVSPDGGNYIPSQVALFVDRDATASNIKDALFVWLEQTHPEDLITIYFAGHGSYESPEFPENFYLFAYDTHYDRVASTGIPLWDIEVALKRFIKAKRVVIIADACHAGRVGRTFESAQKTGGDAIINPISIGLQNLSKIGDGVCVISASGDNQLSKEGKEWGGGVFTYSLLQGLRGEADSNRDKRVTLGELIPFLAERVRRETRDAQIPVVAGKFDPALSIEK